jgi:hypothetical protein
MHSDITPDTTMPSHEEETRPPEAYQEAGQKKPFVQPALIRHDALPAVTTGFFGTFSP